MARSPVARAPIERRNPMNGPTESSQAVPAGLSQGCRPAAADGEPGPEPAQGANLDSEEIAALRAIVEGTARNTGAAFFQSLVRHLATAMGVSYAFVAEFAQAPTRVRTLAYWGRGQLRENIEYDLAETPCEDV